MATAETSDANVAELEQLRNEYTDNERRQAALIVAGDVPAPIETADNAEGRAYRELRQNADFGKYVAAALAHKGVNAGAEAELNQHLGIAENYFPVADAGQRIRGTGNP